MPDDVTVGYIVEHLLQKKLTVIDSFHSHLEPMKFIKSTSLSDQVRVSSIEGNHQARVSSMRFINLKSDKREKSAMRVMG